MAVSYPINYDLYLFLWKKYRPVILKLMIDSADSPQQYQFIQHEFKDINPKEKGGHTFTLEVFKGRAVNNIKMSVVAQDLLEILQKSKKAIELTENSTYQLSLDKHFVFHVEKVESEVEEEIEEEAIDTSTEE